MIFGVGEAFGGWFTGIGAVKMSEIGVGRLLILFDGNEDENEGKSTGIGAGADIGAGGVEAEGITFAGSVVFSIGILVGADCFSIEIPED